MLQIFHKFNIKSLKFFLQFSLLFFVIFSYLFRLTYFPAGLYGDENAFLLFNFRLQNFGIRDWPLYFSDSLNLHPGSMIPFPNSMVLSTFIYKLFGVSQYIGKLSSVFFVLVPCFVISLGISFHKKNIHSFVVSLIALVFIPSILFAGRYIRPEAETIFLGFFSIVILFIPKINGKVQLFISGLVSVFCVCNYPLGIIFPLTLILSFLITSRAWEKFNNIRPVSRCFFWFLGTVLPASYFIYCLMNFGVNKFLNNMLYLKKEYYLFLDKYYINCFNNNYDMFNKVWFLTKSVRGHLTQIVFESLASFELSGFLPKVICILYASMMLGILIIGVYYFKFFIKNKNNPRCLILNLSFLGFWVSVIITFLYNLNTIYGCFAALFSLAFLLNLNFYPDDLALSKPFKKLSSMLLIGILSLNVVTIFSWYKKLLSIQQTQTLTIDKNRVAMNFIKNSYNHQGRIYIDPSVWQIGRKNLGALSEILRGVQPVETPLVIGFNEKVLDYYFYYYAQIESKIKLEDKVVFKKLEPYLKNLKLNFIYLNQHNSYDIFRVYGNRDDLQVLIFENNKVTVYLAKYYRNVCQLVIDGTLKKDQFIMLKNIKNNFGIKSNLIKTESKFLSNYIILNNILTLNKFCSQRYSHRGYLLVSK